MQYDFERKILIVKMNNNTFLFYDVPTLNLLKTIKKKKLKR